MVEHSSPKNLSQSILWTVAYTDQFEYPLTEEEIWQRLLKIKREKGGAKKVAEEVLRRKDFRAALQKLVSQKKLYSGTFKIFDRGAHVVKEIFFLPSRGRLTLLRQKRELASAEKWQQVRHFVQLVSWIPWVKSVWITGSLAMLNAERNQDIDFMVITQSGRLWLTRGLVTFIALMIGKKRTPYGNENQTWCLNLWIDEDNLAMSASKRSAYMAYEVVQAKVVFERNHSARKFWQANIWVRDFLPNWLPKGESK